MLLLKLLCCQERDFVCEWNSSEEPHTWGKKKTPRNKNTRERQQREGEMLSQNPLGSFAVGWGALVRAAEDLQFGLWGALGKSRGKQAPDQAPRVLCC